MEAMGVQNRSLVVIDGLNVATARDKTHDWKRLKKAIEYFERLEIRCVALVPRYTLDIKPQGGCNATESARMQTDSWDTLNELVNSGKVSLTPSQASDDLYIIGHAMQHSGYIVTNDMFRDHVYNRKTFHGTQLTRQWVDQYCIDFAFVLDEFVPNTEALNRLSSSVKRHSSSLIEAVEQPKQLPEPQTTLKRVDMSDVTVYSVPWLTASMIYGPNGATLKQLEDLAQVHVSMPSPVVLNQQDRNSIVNLSIYGSPTQCQVFYQAVEQLLSDAMQL